MNNKKATQRLQNTAAGGARTTRDSGTGVFSVRYPALWLALAALVMYIPSLFMKFTELDDVIFIRDFAHYNEDIHNLITSFQRGLFDAVKDPYYRPLFLDAMILNYQACGLEAVGYHLVNMLLHMGVVVLLYRLLCRLHIKELHAFILSLVFAVHPVLSQAVAWIPGRNDTMLAIFILAFLSQSIDYSNEGKTRPLVLSCLFLLLAFFTKETAVFAAPSAFVLLVLMLGKKWTDKRLLVQYGVWVACFAIWYAARAAFSIGSSGIASSQALTDFIHRIPVLVQYIGKIFLPLNLNVFPTQEDTVYYYGIAAIVILAAIIYLNRQRNSLTLLAGFAVFLLFMMPALLVPLSLNKQTFEHRLYLPVIGMLIILSQTILFVNKLDDKKLLTVSLAVCGLLAAINFVHQQDFSSPRSFWTAAVAGSPNSAYANMMLAARLDKDEFQRSESLFRKAYSLNPHEKYINFYMGQMLQNKDSVLASEPYLLAEKNISDYYQCDFLLAYAAIQKKDYDGAISRLQSFLKNDPGNKPAQNNLLLLYIDTHQDDKARQQVQAMRAQGMSIPPAVLTQLHM